ncbi:Proteasome B-type subunit [Spraguea lophii 42_110]|uniref:proteasome endopeptidase complex n=1 Tax=Spraguea lophii (strain 42_110) TaxID=1358809 RepID=S7XLE1_SPRLO|nr:Proteasome B-type subunit [Spraguea lophii 42_110]
MHTNEEVMTGTTLLAVKTSNGVIIASDTRTSAGIYITSRITNKLTEVEEKIYCLRSGSAADTQTIVKVVKSRFKQHYLIGESEPLVKDCAEIVSNIIYEYPQMLAGIIVAGYDNVEKGSIYSIGLGGVLLKKNFAIGGSGSIFLYSLFDSMYKEDMSDEEKFEFAKKAVALAIKRDNASGGCVRLSVIKNEGVEKYYFPISEITI